jgi:hypothetical protein
MGQVSTSGLDADARTLALWRRNLASLVAAVFIGFTGFTLVMPFPAHLHPADGRDGRGRHRHVDGRSHWA